MTIKAIGFDYFETIVNANAEGKACIDSMYNSLRSFGYTFTDTDFLTNYQAATSSYRTTRNSELREINNCTWISETLKRMGYETEPTHPQVISVVENYFKPWKIELAPDAIDILQKINGRYTVSLVSNFTDSKFLKKTLKELGITLFFDHIIISDDVGWRKPHPQIFKQFLESSNVKANEAVFVGDNPEADVKGAKDLGIKTVLLKAPNIINLENIDVQPDFTVNSLTEFLELITKNQL